MYINRDQRNGGAESGSIHRTEIKTWLGKKRVSLTIEVISEMKPETKNRKTGRTEVWEGKTKGFLEVRRWFKVELKPL